jgi:hypothetical protein
LRIVSLSSVSSRFVLAISTTGDSPVTVIVSCTPPTLNSPLTLTTPLPDRITPSRF